MKESGKNIVLLLFTFLALLVLLIFFSSNNQTKDKTIEKKKKVIKILEGKKRKKDSNADKSSSAKKKESKCKFLYHKVDDNISRVVEDCGDKKEEAEYIIDCVTNAIVVRERTDNRDVDTHNLPWSKPTYSQQKFMDQTCITHFNEPYHLTREYPDNTDFKDLCVYEGYRIRKNMIGIGESCTGDKGTYNAELMIDCSTVKIKKGLVEKYIKKKKKKKRKDLRPKGWKKPASHEEWLIEELCKKEE